MSEKALTLFRRLLADEPDQVVADPVAKGPQYLIASVDQNRQEQRSVIRGQDSTGAPQEEAPGVDGPLPAGSLRQRKAEAGNSDKHRDNRLAVAEKAKPGRNHTKELHDVMRHDVQRQQCTQTIDEIQLNPAHGSPVQQGLHLVMTREPPFPRILSCALHDSADLTAACFVIPNDALARRKCEEQEQKLPAEHSEPRIRCDRGARSCS